MSKHYLWLTVALRSGLLLCFLAKLALADTTTLQVTGEGLSLFEAKQDAIRQALQLSVEQLIVVDRAVDDTKVLRDRVMSTMNGYVEAFEIESVSTEQDRVLVVANISVSESRIENFLGLTVLKDAKIDGEALFAEQSRRVAQDEANELRYTAIGEIFDRTLRGFPIDAITAEATKIELDENDPSKAKVYMTLAFRKEFVSSLMSSIKTLSTKECDLSVKVRGDAKSSRPDWRSQSGYPNDISSSGGFYCGKEAENGAVACIADQTVRCFVLDTGHYCPSCEDDRVRHYQPVLYVAYLDESGQAASESFCNVIPIDIGIQFNLDAWRTINGRVSPGLWFALDVESRNLWFEVDLHQIDVKRARRIVAVVGFKKVDQLRDEFTLTSIVTDPAYPINGGCSFLRESIERGL